MADERDFELLDDYLADRMSEQDRAAFEQQLKADPDLQHEYALQKHLIQGIKEARIAELKAMLNSVPVPAGNTGNALASKIALGTAATLIVAGGAYWLLSDKSAKVPDVKPQTQQESPVQETVPTVDSQAVDAAEENTAQQQQTPAADIQQADKTQGDKNQTSAGTEHSRPSLAKRPDPLAAPAATDGATPRRSEDDSSRLSKPPATLSPVKPSAVVEVNKNDSQYTFHYQYRDGKLILFGPFEKDQYRVMEFTLDDKRTAFLSYQDKFYQLQGAGGDEQIRPLIQVKDAALIQKLTEYRNGK